MVGSRIISTFVYSGGLPVSFLLLYHQLSIYLLTPVIKPKLAFSEHVCVRLSSFLHRKTDILVQGLKRLRPLFKTWWGSILNCRRISFGTWTLLFFARTPWNVTFRVSGIPKFLNNIFFTFFYSSMHSVTFILLFFTFLYFSLLNLQTILLLQHRFETNTSS